MPFNNSGETHIHGTYNDVAGSQFNIGQITQVFTSTSTALIPRTTANSQLTIDSLATMVAKTGAHSIGSQTIIMPESKPFQDFIAIIRKLQATLYPIIEVLGDTEDLRVLSQELSRTLMTTALAGRIIDILGVHWRYKNLVWCRRLTDKVGRSIQKLREVVEAVKQYKFGVSRRVTGSAKEQLWAAVTHFVSGERNIDEIAREAFRKLIDCTNPLERFLYCAGQGILHQPEYLFNETIWQDLSAEIQSHLSIPRFRSPHGMITRYNRSYPFDSYTTYSDLCTLLGMFDYIHGYVDTATEEILSPKRLSRLIRQRSAPHITVEPVYTCRVIGESGRDNYCPRCESESSYGEWRVCISCGLRFQTTAPKLPDNHQLHLHRSGQHARYVMAMRFDWSVLSSVKDLAGEVPDSATALHFFRLLSNFNFPIRDLYLHLFRQPSILIPDELDTGSSLPNLHHLNMLILSSYNETFELPPVSLPQITTITLYLSSMPDSPIIDWLLNFCSLTYLILHLKWDDPLGSIQRLLLGLPALEDLYARYIPYITTSNLAQITEIVQGIRTQDHPIRSIAVDALENRAEVELPDPWECALFLCCTHFSCRLSFRPPYDARGH